MTDFDVTIPRIKSTAKIAGGAEIVLKWEKKVEFKVDEAKKSNVINAFTAGAFPHPKKQKR